MVLHVSIVRFNGFVQCHKYPALIMNRISPCTNSKHKQIKMVMFATILDEINLHRQARTQTVMPCE